MTALSQFSTKTLADFLNVSEGFISHVKTGRRKLPLEHCVRLFLQFGISLHELRPDAYPETLRITRARARKAKPAA